MKKNMDPKKISPEKVHQKLNNAEKVFLIDTLPADHFTKVHIKGAVNACVFEVVFIENVSKIVPDRGKEIILYGSSDMSMDALTAAKKLTREGYQNVSAMEGGLKQWTTLGFAVVGVDPTFFESMRLPEKWIDHDYVVDLGESRVEWVGRNSNKQHHGTIGLTKGEINVKNGQIGGRFELDMKSIRNIDLEGDPLQPVLINHLMSEDFFLAQMFPRVTFTITSAKLISEVPSSEPNFEILGLLELRGIRKDIRFFANASGEQCDELKIEAHFDLDRTRWGVIYGSTRFFEHLGMHLVFDSISLQLRLLAK